MALLKSPFAQNKDIGKLKILITNTGPWGTGSFVVAEAVAKTLLKLGHQVKIFFPDTGHESHDKEHYYGNPELYEIWQFPIQNDDAKLESFPLIIPDPNPRVRNGLTYKNLSNAQWRLYENEFLTRIKKVIHDFKPDIIESEHIWAMAYLLHKLGYSYITAAHNSDQMGFHYDKHMQKYAITAAQNAQLIFSPSEGLKQEIAQMYKVSKDKIVVIPNGYDQNTFKPMSVNRETVLQSLNVDIPEDAQIITFAGKMSKTKGMDTILESNALLKNKNIHFLLFGSGKIDDVIPKAEQKNYCFDNLHFLGHHSPETLAQVHNIAKLNIIPSRTEGFPISCLEAMGCGIPIVFTPTGDMKNFAVGEMIETENPQALAQAILKVLDLPDKEYQALSKRALETAKKFSWEKITKKRLDCYTNAL